MKTKLGNRVRQNGLYVFDNPHVEGAGDAPTLEVREGDYVCEFTNQYGEKWVAHIGEESGPSAGAMVVYGGDVGWENEHVVRKTGSGFVLVGEDGEAVTLNGEEWAWLMDLIRVFGVIVDDFEPSVRMSQMGERLLNTFSQEDLARVDPLVLAQFKSLMGIK